MKKRFLVIAVAIASLSIFNACEKSNDLTNLGVSAQQVETFKPDVYSENGYLVFKNFEAVDSIITVLNSMSEESKLNWEKSMGIVSARSQFENIFSEYERLDSYEEFLDFKSKYSEKLMFNEQDSEDCSIDYPFATKYFVPVLNSEGILKVGLSLIKYTKDDHIVIKNGDMKILNDLQANLDNENVYVYPKLKSTDVIETLISNFPEDNPYIPYHYDAWHEVNTTSKRRMINELLIERYRANYKDLNWEEYWQVGYVVYFQQRAHKRSWGSWNSYNTRYYADDLKAQVGNSPKVFHNPYSPMISSECKTCRTAIYTYNSLPIYGTMPSHEEIPDVSFSALTSCQGFGIDQLYPIDFVEHSGFTSSDGNTWLPAPSY